MLRPRGLPAVQRWKEVHLSVQRPLRPSLGSLERIPCADPRMRQWLNFVQDDWELQGELRRMAEGGDWASLDAYVRETSLSQFCGLWGGDARQGPRPQWLHHV